MTVFTAALCTAHLLARPFFGSHYPHGVSAGRYLVGIALLADAVAAMASRPRVCVSSSCRHGRAQRRRLAEPIISLSSLLLVSQLLGTIGVAPRPGEGLLHRLRLGTRVRLALYHLAPVPIRRVLRPNEGDGDRTPRRGRGVRVVGAAVGLLAVAAVRRRLRQAPAAPAVAGQGRGSNWSPVSRREPSIAEARSMR